MSKLLSLSNSNSKNNSYNANGSKESKNSQKRIILVMEASINQKEVKSQVEQAL